MKEGDGLYMWEDGSYYNGQWKGNEMHGVGLFMTSDGR